MYKTTIAAAAVALFGILGSAQAATLGGTFNVKAVNVTNLNSAGSQATITNFNNYFNILGLSDVFTYTGDLDFKTTNGSATKVSDWLATGKGVGGVGSGVVSDLDATFGDKQLSKGNILSSTATSTFFLFERVGALTDGAFTVGHDDGIAIFDDGSLLGGSVGPNSFKPTNVGGFDGGKFSLLYVATNSDPSILKVDTTTSPVPVPAPLALLASALAGLGLLRRRRATA